MIALKRSNIFISFIFFSFITLWQTGLFWVGTTNNNFSVADNLSTQPLKYKEFTENTAPSESFISPPIPGDAVIPTMTTMVSWMWTNPYVRTNRNCNGTIMVLAVRAIRPLLTILPTLVFSQVPRM